jgi:hypothetical protein
MTSKGLYILKFSGIINSQSMSPGNHSNIKITKAVIVFLNITPIVTERLKYVKVFKNERKR